MKQMLLLLAAIVSSSLLYGQQDVIWQEDFSEGMYGWSVRTSLCDNYGSSEFGIWRLASGTIDGEPIEIEEGYYEWSFVNPLEYTITYVDTDEPTPDTEYLTVYSRYEMSGDTLKSDIDINAFVAATDGDAFEEESVDGIVRWALNSNIPSVDLPAVAAVVGVGNPTIVFSNGGQNFTYTSQDGLMVFEYQKVSECGTFWTWTPNGNIGYGALNQQPGTVIDSETRANGSVVINTLYHNSLGDPAYSPGAPPYPQYVSELVSPAIDVSAADRALSLELTELMAFLNTPGDAPNGLKTSFQVSTDDGATWSDAVDLNPTLPTNTIFNGDISVPIPTAYVGDAESIRIKFTWATDFWYWVIDDISIVERVSYEMQANSNFFGIGSNAFTPISQADDMYFMSDIQNNGGLTAENVTLNLTVVDEAGAEVYNEDKPYGDIVPDSLAENDFFSDPLTADLLANGVYTGTYTLRHDSLDSNPLNDTLRFQFAMTDSLFAKEAGRTRGIFLTNERDWFIGNVFYVPNGDGMYARYMSFMIDNAADAVNGAGVVTTYLYETDGDVNDDGTIAPDEYNTLALNSYTFDGTEDEELITIPMSLEETGVALSDDKYYMVVVQYDGVNDDDQVAISASEDFDYAADYFMNDSLMRPRFADVVAFASEDPSFGVRGFGGGTIPVIRMSIGTNPDLSGDPFMPDNTNDLLSDAYQMSVYPNPANEQFQLSLDLPEQTDVEVRLLDLQGRLLFSKQYDQLKQGAFTYDAASLPAGTYTIQMVTPAGMKTQKVIVSH